MRSSIFVVAIVLALSACALGGEIVFEPNIEYANPDNQHLQLNMARPKDGAEKMPAVVCIHGGGFRAGNRTRWDALCKELAGRGYVAVTIQYRLSPKYQFPAAVHDAKSAVRWVRLNASKYHIDPNRIGAVGDSAGGHLVQFLAVTDGVKEFEGEENPGVSSRVTCVVNYYGPSDFTKSYGKSVDAAEVLPLFLGGDLEQARERHIQSSPLNWVTPHAAPTLLIHGTEDKYVAYEQATWMHDRLKAAGVEVQLLTLEGAGHGFKGADAEKAAAAANEFLDKHLLKEAKAQAAPRPAKTVRVAAAQPKSRLIDWHLKDGDEVLKRVDQSLTELEGLIDRAAAEHADVIALPEDTLGLGTWEAGNEALARQLLPRAVKIMLEKLGAAASKHQIYVICCNDFVESDGRTYNTAFFLGRDGKEIGRYHKVCPTIHERVCTPGDSFPVFPTKDLGGVGMLICYDMVFPETARCLALGGADIIFHPTLGGAAIGDEELSRAAFRTRAVENFVYIVVAQRGNGSMIISPQGKILAEADGRDSLAIADIDPYGGREGGDAMNSQRDMRARLFRERNPAAFGTITDSNPPVLAKIPATISERQAVEVAHKVLTIGQEEFRAADTLARDGKLEEASAAFKRLQTEYKDSWIDRVSTQRLAMLETKRAGPAVPDKFPGISSKYPGDRNIDKDPRVLFIEDFEEPTLDALKSRWEDVRQPNIFSFTSDIPDNSAGKQSLLMTHIGGQGDGGHLYRRLPKGIEKCFARFYVKFDPDCAPIHHFGTCLGGNNPATRWPQVKAGFPPPGDKGFWTGIEPFGDAWRWDFYTYWCEMRGSPPRGQTWGNSFVRDDSLKVQKGKWTCVEVMVKMNDIGDTNGEMALWLDGKPISHLGKGFPKGKWVFDKFMKDQGGEAVRWNQQKGDRENFNTAAGGEPFEGFRWRTTKELDVNFVWAYLYITGAPQGHVSKVWFDHIVVASEYIGPIAK